MYQFTQFKNGLRVATAEMPHMMSVSVGVWVGVGSRYEPAPLNGACHFIEHMLFKGTKRRSAREISQAVEGVGGHLNAFTSEEATCFYARVLIQPAHSYGMLRRSYLNKTKQTKAAACAFSVRFDHMVVIPIKSNLCYRTVRKISY